MLTPRFTISQDEKFLLIKIFAPFTNVTDTEIFMDECDFRFYSRPYFLRLHLPHPIVESKEAEAKFDADTVAFNIKAPKLNVGQYFEGLDLLTNLLVPPSKRVQNKIEVLGGEDGQEWYFDQCLQIKTPIEAMCKCDGYGFAFQKNDVFGDVECAQILDIKNVDDFSANQRRSLRLLQEQEAFSDDHYLCDLYNLDPTVVSRISEDSEYNAWPNEFDADERLKLIELRDCAKHLPILKDESLICSTLYGLVDILFAYCYDLLTTQGEHSCESGWTISKLCSSMTCCEKFENLSEVVIACLRRSLCYPLYRNWLLSFRVLEDVCSLLSTGTVAVLKVLLEISSIFSSYDGRYIFNQIYIQPYSVWIQCEMISKRLLPLAHEIRALTLDKKDVGFYLFELEAAAKASMIEAEVDNLSHAFKNMNTSNADVDSDDDISSDYTSYSSSDELSSSEIDFEFEKDNTL